MKNFKDKKLDLMTEAYMNIVEARRPSAQLYILDFLIDFGPASYNDFKKNGMDTKSMSSPLNSLVKNGYVKEYREDNKRQKFEVTESGINFWEEFNNTSGVFKPAPRREVKQRKQDNKIKEMNALEKIRSELIAKNIEVTDIMYDIDDDYSTGFIATGAGGNLTILTDGDELTAIADNGFEFEIESIDQLIDSLNYKSKYA